MIELDQQKILFFEAKNWHSKSAKDAIILYKNELAKRTQSYLKNHPTRKKLHSKTITQLSAIVNLNHDHKAKNLKPLLEYLEKSLDTRIIQASIHRDEGHISDDGIPVKNYHAHIEFMGIDSQGNSIRRKLSQSYLSELQNQTAQILNMQRGTNYTRERKPRPKRLNTYEYKAQAKRLQEQRLRLSPYPNIITNIKSWITPEPESHQAKQKELKLEISKLRAELKVWGAKRADYAKLEALNKKLNDKIKNKDLTILQLQKELKAPKKNISSTNENDKIKKLADLAAQEINKLKEELEAKDYQLQKQERTINIFKQELLSYRGSDRQIMRKQLSDLQFENKELKREIEVLKNKPLPNPKNSKEYKTLQMEYDKLYSSFLKISQEQTSELQKGISPRP